MQSGSWQNCVLFLQVNPSYTKQIIKVEKTNIDKELTNCCLSIIINFCTENIEH